jgi:membrane fusion protein (multidrug efflux system)
MEEHEHAADEPYRAGYREGFRDARTESAKQREQEHAESKGGKDGKGSGDGKGKDRGKTPLYKRPLLVALVLAVVLVLIIAIIIFWRHSRHHETTDDAFIDGVTSQVAAQTSGRVLKLFVTDNQYVQAGDPLLDIDSRETDAHVAQAAAQLAAAQGQYEQSRSQVAVSQANAEQADAAARESEADWRKAAEDAQKYRSVDPDAVAKQQADTAFAAERSARAKLDASRMSARAARAQIEAATSAVEAATAQIQSARANLDNASLLGSYTHVIAPVAGRVTRRSVDVGNVVANGQALLALVSPYLWVTANYKETQLTRMRRGQAVEIVVDAYPHLKFRGRIDSIQHATGAFFSTLPAENATGNYVKVVQRVPVKIVFEDDRIRDYVIGPGMSVSPNVTLP